MKKFTRTIENFVCGHCGNKVIGNGYTNHCPKCFWSKHVDVNPGDRLNDCQGLMKPVSVSAKNGNFVVTQACQKCGANKQNKLAKIDQIDSLINLMKNF